MKLDSYFEDSRNVYIIMELCPNQTLMEFVKRRIRLTEPEAAVLCLQLLDGMRYLHTNSIIHRDLKLGNLFINKDMEVRIGDFGLATQVTFAGERKKTVCGTPNYIAPEILDNSNGHSYEVDTWAFGVILFTMLTGKPPFETADVKSTYKRIRENKYAFPPDVPISDAAKDLIMRILVPVPEQRPSLEAVARHAFFTTQMIPSALPVSCLTAVPLFHSFQVLPGSHLVETILSQPIKGLVSKRSKSAAAAQGAGGEAQGGSTMQRAHSAPELPVPQAWGAPAPDSARSAQESGFPRASTAGRVAEADQENMPSYAGVAKAGAQAWAGNKQGFYPAQQDSQASMPPPPISRQPSGGAVSSSASVVGESASLAAGDMAAFGRHGLHLDTATQAFGEGASQASSLGSGRDTPGSLDGQQAWLAGLQSTQSQLGAGGFRPGSASSTVPLSSPRSAAMASRPASANNNENAYCGPPAAKAGRLASSSSAPAAAQASGVATGSRRVGVWAGQPPAAAPPVPAPTARTAQPSYSPTSTQQQPISARAPLRPLGQQGAPSQQAQAPSFRPYSDEHMSSPPATAGTGPTRQQQADSAMSESTSSYRAGSAAAAPAPSPGSRSAAFAPAAPPAAPPASSTTGANETLRTMYNTLENGEEYARYRHSSTVGRVQPSSLQSTERVNVWVTCWVDVTAKYGLGYLLSNGCVGVCFNDATKIIASPDGERYEYIERQSSTSAARAQLAASGGAPGGQGLALGLDGTVRQVGLVGSYPAELKKKVTLLRHFRAFLFDLYSKRRGMSEGLVSAAEVEAAASTGIFANAQAEATNQPPAMCPAMHVGPDEAACMSAGAAQSGSMPLGSLVYMKKWVRTRRALLFRLSSRCMQACFLDGQNIIFHMDGAAVTVIDTNANRAAFTTASIFECASPAILAPPGDEGSCLSPPALGNRHMSGQQQELVDDMCKRVRYAKDVARQLLGMHASV